MFDPISLIVGALVKGLLAGVEASAQEAVTDGYRSLRDAISRRYGQGVASTIDTLESRPDSPQYQAGLAQALRNAGADRDQELLRLSRGLWELVEHPERAFVPDRVQRLRRSSGLGAIGQLLDDHIGRVLAVRSNYRVEDTDLLAANISRNGSVPQDVRAGMAGLHARIRSIIEQVSAQVENQRYAEVENAIDHLQAGLAERQRAADLVRTDKQMHVSYETLRLTVEFLSDLNQGILARIERESSPQRLSNMMFGNAIMIYELTDFAIGYVSGFTLGGDLERLHADAKRRVAETRGQQKAFEDRLREQDIPQADREPVLENIRGREAALQELDTEWDKYLGEVGQMRVKVDQVRGILPTLDMIRENARLQIMTLQLVAMLRVLKQNFESIKGTVDTLQGFRLAPLSSARVRRLLGMDDFQVS